MAKIEISKNVWNVVGVTEKAWLQWRDGWKVTNKIENATSFGLNKTVQGATAESLVHKFGGAIQEITQITTAKTIAVNK